MELVAAIIFLIISLASVAAAVYYRHLAITTQQSHQALPEQSQLVELAAIATRLGDASEIEDVIAIALDRVLVLTGMHSAVIYHAEHPSYPLRCIGQKLLPGTPLHPAQELFSESSISGQALRERRTIATSNAAQSAEFGPRMIAVGAQSAITLPLVGRGHAVGVLQILSHQPREFSPALKSLLEGISQQLAIALDNALLWQAEQRRQQRAEMLHQISLVVIATTDPAEAIEIALQLLADLIPYDVAAVTFVENAHYRVGKSASELNRTYFPPIGSLPITQRVIGSWSSLFIPDTRQYSDWAANAGNYPNIRCYIGAPLLRRDQVFGVFNLMSLKPYIYSEEDVNFIQTLATQFADAIEKAQLFRRMSQREQVADDLILMGVALGSTLDESELLNLLCQQSAPIFRVDGVYLWLLQGDYMIGMAAIGVGARRFIGMRRKLTADDSLGARIIRERRPRFVNHVQNSSMVSEDFLSITQAHSALGVPILRGLHPVGALMLIDTQNDERFDESDLEQLRLLGVQAALAIENARLFAETRRRLDQLRLVNEVGRVATSILTLTPLMEGISQPLFEEFRYHAISLLLVENDALQLYSLLIEGQKVRPLLSQRLLTTDSTARTALLDSNPVLRQDKPTLSMLVMGSPIDAEGWYELAVPLIIAEEVIGILNVERNDPITAEELDVLEPLTAQIAITVSNVRLFEMVRQQMLELDSRIADATLQLRIEKEHTEAILQSVADAVIMTDLTGQMITANPVAEAILRDTAITYGSEGGSLLERIVDLVHKLINDDKDVQTMIIEHGSVALQAKAAKVTESGQDVGAVIVLRDITYLHEVDRLKTQFVSTVSHELRTPLSNIKLYLQLLQTGKAEKRANYQAIMESEANRLERLISDLLDLSRLDQKVAHHHEPIDLDQLVRGLVETNMPQAEAKQLHLVYISQLTAPLPPVQGDRDQLTQVMTNLIGNAIHYTPESGTITVSTTQVGDCARVEVRDNGIGISPEDLPHIFERFYRGANVKTGTVPGTGLGLAICKEIIMLHDGSISVESNPGQGSAFFVMLPLSRIAVGGG